jgi:hypothetical protein
MTIIGDVAIFGHLFFGRGIYLRLRVVPMVPPTICVLILYQQNDEPVNSGLVTPEKKK